MKITPLEQTITSCLHLLMLNKDTEQLSGGGSAVLVELNQRYFICTVNHNLLNPDNIVGIATFKPTGKALEMVELKDLGLVQHLKLSEKNAAAFEKALVPKTEAEMLQEAIADKTTSDVLDIAYTEVRTLPPLHQQERTIEVEGQKFKIKSGYKRIVPLDYEIKIDPTSKCNFYGLTGTYVFGKTIDSDETLILDLSIAEVQKYFIKFDLGKPIGNHKNFEGCSGAPIFDRQGQLIALLANGDIDVSQPYVYGFRADKLKQYLLTTYFGNATGTS
jgi:hypothetical protein